MGRSPAVYADFAADAAGDHRWSCLRGYFGEDAGANGSAALSDGEAEVLFEGDRVDQLDLHLGVVARHDHLDAVGQFDLASDVGGPDVELRLVAGEERGSTSALFGGQDVDLCLALGVRGDGARLGEDSTARHFLAVDTSEKATDGVAGDALR